MLYMLIDISTILSGRSQKIDALFISAIIPKILIKINMDIEMQLFCAVLFESVALFGYFGCDFNRLNTYSKIFA